MEAAIPTLHQTSSFANTVQLYQIWYYVNYEIL